MIGCHSCEFLSNSKRSNRNETRTDNINALKTKHPLKDGFLENHNNDINKVHEKNNYCNLQLGGGVELKYYLTSRSLAL